MVEAELTEGAKLTEEIELAEDTEDTEDVEEDSGKISVHSDDSLGTDPVELKKWDRRWSVSCPPIDLHFLNASGLSECTCIISLADRFKRRERHRFFANSSMIPGKDRHYFISLPFFWFIQSD